MAMNGINMPLAFTGQEYVWHKFYSSLNISDEDILWSRLLSLAEDG